MTTRSAPVKPVKPTPVKPASGKGAPPSFDSLFLASDNPLNGIEPAGSLEDDAANEIAVAESFILDQRRDEREQWRLLTEPDFWSCLVFQSREQRDEFLAGIGWADLGPRYVNGLIVAQRLGVKVTPIALPRKAVKPMPKALRGAKIIGQGGDP